MIAQSSALASLLNSIFHTYAVELRTTVRCSLKTSKPVSVGSSLIVLFSITERSLRFAKNVVFILCLST